MHLALVPFGETCQQESWSQKAERSRRSIRSQRSGGEENGITAYTSTLASVGMTAREVIRDAFSRYGSPLSRRWLIPMRCVKRHVFDSKRLRAKPVGSVSRYGPCPS